MNKTKTIFAFALALCLMLSLCACTAPEEPGEPSEPATSEPTIQAPETTDEATTASVDDGKVLYKVTVVDEAGNPISGAMVQICKDTCLPGATDASGVAEFRVVEDDYKVSFLTLPAGYTYSTEQQDFYFEDGSYEMTITLKAEA